MMKFIQDSWLVIISSLVFGLLVAGVHGGLKDQIEQNKIEKREQKMAVIFGDGCEFGLLTVNEGQETERNYYKVVKDDNVIGYCFKGQGEGYGGTMELLIAVDSDFEKCLGYEVIYSQETPGIGDKILLTGKKKYFYERFKGLDCPSAGAKLKVIAAGIVPRNNREIVAISQATITSEAVVKIVNDTVIEMKALVE